MTQATMPDNPYEKCLELGLLEVVMVCVSEGMPIENILKVLERVRHTVTEIKLEFDNENQNKL